MKKILRHVGVVVSNLDKAIKLYQEYFGFELVEYYSCLSGEYQSNLVGIKNVEMRVAILRTHDDNKIELLEYVSHPRKKMDAVRSNNVGISHIAFTVKNLQEFYDRRKEYNVRFISPPLKSPDGYVKVAYAVLMEESIVELVEVLTCQDSNSIKRS